VKGDYIANEEKAYPSNAAPQDVYREASRHSHKLLGCYLALWAWVHRADCLVVPRSSIFCYLGLSKNMRDKRLIWMRSDLESLFPYSKTLKYSGGKFADLYLSRVELPDSFFNSRMDTSARLGLLESGGIRAKEVNIPSEREMVAVLAHVVHGIGDFPVDQDE
jgi:hypothetical protein